MKRSLQFSLLASLLFGCQTLSPALVLTPQASVPEPGELSFDTVYNSETGCEPTSANVQFSVYSNQKEIFYETYNRPIDKSRPVPQAQIQIGDKAYLSDQSGRVSFPRPQGVTKVRVIAPGYLGANGVYRDGNLCARNDVVLSPLSAEEQAGTPIPLIKALLSGDLPLHTDAATEFAYGLVRNPEQLDALAPRLRDSGGQLGAANLTILRAALSQGQAIAFFSNGSQGLGDTYELVTRVTDTDKQTTLATHLGIIQSDPAPLRPVGDRFSTLIEAVAIPGDTETLVIDALNRQGDKKRLAVKASDALMTISPRP